MRIRQMVTLSFSLFVLAVASIPAVAEIKQVVIDAPEAKPLMQVGVQLSEAPFGGITVKKRVSSSTILQGTVSLSENVGSVSTRVLWDLGTKGNVFRYAGVGVGTGYETTYDNLTARKVGIYGAEGFIGIDYPLDWFGKATPFSTSLEVVMQGVQRTTNGKAYIHPQTKVDMGFSYWF